MLAAGAAAPAVANAYPPQPPVPGEPSIDVTAFSPECVSEAPYISYAIVPVGFSSTGPADLTIRDIDGEIVEKHTVDELTGRLVYPGAAVSSDGTAIDWPGWKLDNGMWVRDPSDRAPPRGPPHHRRDQPDCGGNGDVPGRRQRLRRPRCEVVTADRNRRQRRSAEHGLGHAGQRFELLR